MPNHEDKSVALEYVLKAEREEIEEIRRRRRAKPGCLCKEGIDRTPRGDERHAPKMPIAAGAPEWTKRDKNKDWRDAVEKAHAKNFVGLAFSGGGIRSATFNLGVLQALADLGLLHRIDYLSTVSGGGYIGGWLAGWTKRAKGGFKEVQNALATNRVHQEDDKEPTQIRFLRVFSNYLTPKLGVFSGDTWATAGILLRNMLLNQVIVLALLSAVLLLPRAAERFGLWVRSAPWLGLTCVVVGCVLLLVAFSTILKNMADLDMGGAKGWRKWTRQGWVLALAGVPLFATAALASLWQVARCKPGDCAPVPYRWVAERGAEAYGGIWLVATLVGLAYRYWIERKEKEEKHDINGGKPAAAEGHETRRKRQIEVFGTRLLAAVAAGALAGWLYAVLSSHMDCWRTQDALTAGVPLVVGIFLLAGTLQIGLMGIFFPDRQREWWGRLGGWLLLWGLAWLGIFWLALYFPDFIQNNHVVKAGWKKASEVLTPAWIATTLGGVLAGKSRASGEPGTLTWKDVLAKVAPYVFIVGLMCWISWGIDQIQNAHLLADQGKFITGNRLWLAISGCLAVALIMAWRVDVNQFSMHMYYRNRLVRAFLGASNPNRWPNRFTGFDLNDDLHLKDFSIKNKDTSYDGPYPVLNASLNLVKGQDLAWQERKAESFVMTPRFCGYDVWLEEQDTPIMQGEKSAPGEGKNLDRYGYCPTEEYAFPAPLYGPDLGLAMGISGAAASPNMGFYTSPPVAFLMTIFNVRLGQWLGNPRHRKTSGRPTPNLGLWCLINELLAGTNDKARYVYLSDGGHFENMALYELVKRRCGLIIVCDAEADDQYCFGGLGNAIRKCRIDLGIDIVLDVKDIKPKKDGEPSEKHYAIGRIHYENVDMNAPTGTIIYFKASLTGDEPADVKNYARKHSTFPHESTVDQWFSESQFESYRVLGYHEVTSSIPNSIRPVGLEADAPSPLAKVPTVSSASPKNPVWATVEAAAAQLASTLQAGAEAIAAGFPGPRHEVAVEDNSPDLQWKKRFEEFGFDVSNLKVGS